MWTCYARAFLFTGIFSPTVSKMSKELAMNDFCVRQFNNIQYTGTQIHYDIGQFETMVNNYHQQGFPLIEGYAPFCKHMFVPNFANVKCGYVEKTEENKRLIESCYEARKENELPVLIEYIDQKKMEAPIATHLDIILYSREQIIKENEAMGTEFQPNDSPWGIISVKGQLCDYETPMQPITMMRNALGKEYGGSGVPLDSKKYMDSYFTPGEMIGYTIRTFANIFIARFYRQKFLKTTEILRRCWPIDVDLLFHMNNTAYLRIAELCRLATYAYSPVALNWMMIEKKVIIMVAQQTIVFHKPINPFQQYAVQTTISVFDKKFLFYRHVFLEPYNSSIHNNPENKRKVYCTVESKIIAKYPSGKTVPTDELIGSFMPTEEDKSVIIY